MSWCVLFDLEFVCPLGQSARSSKACMGNSLNCLAQCRESQESRQRILFLQIGRVATRA